MTLPALSLDPVRSIDRRLPLRELPDERFDTVMAFWRSVRGDRAMPPCKAVRPEMLRGALGYVNLIDVLHEDAARPAFRFRLIGSEVAQAYGTDMTGRRVDEVQPSHYADIIQRQFEETVADRAPCLHEVRFYMDWREHWLIRLSVPFGETDDAVERILTISAFDPDISRFDIRDFTERLLKQEAFYARVTSVVE